MTRDLLLTAIGIFIGWVISYFFYRKSTKDLDQKHEEQLRLQTLSLRAMENAGLVKYNRDDSGKITGLIIELAALSASCQTASATLTKEVIRAEPIPPSPNKPQQ